MAETIQRLRRLYRSTLQSGNDRPFRYSLFEERQLLNTLSYHWSRNALERRKADEETPGDVLTTVIDEQPGLPPYRVRALQLRPEFDAFVRFLADRQPRTVLELGTFQGGSLYAWARAIDSTERLVSVDQPVWNERTHTRRAELYPTFSERTNIDIVYGNSHAERTYEEVAGRFEEAVDFLFVDGDHTYDGVEEDFTTYRQLVDDDGIIAFHDIKRHARDRGEKRARLRAEDDLAEDHVTIGEAEWGVSAFWEDVRSEYDTQEFLTHPAQMGAGIGVIDL